MCFVLYVSVIYMCVCVFEKQTTKTLFCRNNVVYLVPVTNNYKCKLHHIIHFTPPDQNERRWRTTNCLFSLCVCLYAVFNSMGFHQKQTKTITIYYIVMHRYSLLQYSCACESTWLIELHWESIGGCCSFSSQSRQLNLLKFYLVLYHCCYSQTTIK